MKKLSMSLLLIGLTNLGFGQYQPSKINNSISQSYDIAKVENHYFREAQKGYTPDHIKRIQKEVVKWESKNSCEFERGNGELLTVTFRTTLGYIAVQYNQDGKIEFAEERFQNVLLPKPTTRNILKQYPGWKFAHSKYVLTYKDGRVAKKFLKVAIKKGSQKKQLRIHA